MGLCQRKIMSQICVLKKEFFQEKVDFILVKSATGQLRKQAGSLSCPWNVLRLLSTRSVNGVGQGDPLPTFLPFPPCPARCQIVNINSLSCQKSTVNCVVNTKKLIGHSQQSSVLPARHPSFLFLFQASSQLVVNFYGLQLTLDTVHTSQLWSLTTGSIFV